MNYDYAKIAREVIAAVGGQENIRSAAHCATRLRLIVADRAKADDERVGEIDAVKGTFYTAGQYQIIFGTGHVNRVYEQIAQLGIAETTASEAKEAKMEGKNRVQKAIRTFGDVFVPVIPALVATGLFLLHALENVLLVIVESALALPLGLGGLVVGFFWSIITLTGVHHIFNMLEISLLSSTGFNPFNAILCMCGFSSAGVCLAISLKAKKKEIRAIGPSATASALLGIGEPALFGVILRYGLKPFLLSCSINGVAGMIAMLLGMKGTGNGITTIPGMLLYIYSPTQILMYIVLAAAVFATAFSLTWMFAVPPEVMEADAPKGAKKAEPAPVSAPFPEELGSVAKGVFVPMEELPDQTFAQGVLGTCCGVTPEEGRVYAPMDGTVSQLAETCHAVGIEAEGVELLIHVGVDTVEMKGDGFKSHVREGQAVKKGGLLLTVDLEKVKAAGHPSTIVVVVTNSEDLASVEAAASGAVRPGDPLMKLKA